MNPYLFCYVSRKIDRHFVYLFRSVSRSPESTLGAENGTNALLFILLVIAAVGVIQARPQVWIGIDFILLR